MNPKRIVQGVELTDEILQKIKAAASLVHHGAITIHLDATRATADIEITSRERIDLCPKTPT